MTWFRDPRGDFISVYGAKTGKVIDSRGGKRVELKDERGNTLATVPLDALDPLTTLVGGSVPAAFISSSGEITWRPIVGWRVRSDGSAEPVLHGDRPAGSMFIAMHGGAMIGNGEFFKDLKAAVTAVRAASTGEVEAA